jgi:hypothetical protein
MDASNVMGLTLIAMDLGCVSYKYVDADFRTGYRVRFFIATSTDPHIKLLVFHINTYPEIEKICGFDCADASGARRYRKVRFPRNPQKVMKVIMPHAAVHASNTLWGRHSEIIWAMPISNPQ